MNKACPQCGVENKPHYRFCLHCGNPLLEAGLPDESSVSIPAVNYAVPVQRPREVSSSWWKFASAHRFGLLFGGIWAGIGGILMSVFLVIGFGFPPILLGALIASPFFFIGMAIVMVSLARANYKSYVARHGALVRGQILESRIDHTYVANGRSSTRVSFGYTDALGQTHTGHMKIFDTQLIASHQPGAEVPLLVDPTSPTDVVAPSLLGVTFETPEPIADTRPEHLDDSAEATEPSLTSWRAELSADSDPPHVPLWLRLLRRKRTAVAGNIDIEGTQVRLSKPGLDAPQSVDLSRPFSVGCSAWPVSADEVELNVMVRARSAPATDEGLQFKVKLPQTRVSARIPVKQETSPCLAAPDFDRLWATIRYHASLQGISLPQVAGAATLPDFAAHPKAQAQEEQAQVPAQSRRR